MRCMTEALRAVCMRLIIHFIGMYNGMYSHVTDVKTTLGWGGTQRGCNHPLSTNLNYELPKNLKVVSYRRLTC